MNSEFGICGETGICAVGATFIRPLVGNGRGSAGDRKGRPYGGTSVCFVGAGALDGPPVGNGRGSAGDS
jgi:hypothetical protein